MKFSCERCGKKYATAETPSPGRVYKLKCKACGHLIVVKAPASAAPAQVGQPEPSPAPLMTPPPLPPPAPESLAPPPSPELPPEVPLEIGAPEPAAPTNGAPPASTQFFGDRTTEVSMTGTGTTPLPSEERRLAPPPVADAFEPAGDAPPPGDGGYVDLFSDVGATKDDEKPSDDPFLAAARASLPEGYGAGNPGAPDPFAALREERPPLADAPAAQAGAGPAGPKVPYIPKPPAQKSALPIVLIGGGALVLVGILAFVMLSSSKRAPAPAPPPAVAVQAQAPAPPPPPPLAQEAPVEPAIAVAPEPPPAAQAKPAPAPKISGADERRAREERRRREREEAQARADRARAERDAKERERQERARAEREQREREARERERQERERVAAASASEEAEGSLTQAQIETTLRSTRKAFDACIQAARGTDVKLDGRRVMLRLNIQTSGTVTYPTLDDVTLNGTEIGSCLKSAARLMVFPKFKGDTMHVEVPLVMR